MLSYRAASNASALLADAAPARLPSLSMRARRLGHGYVSLSAAWPLCLVHPHAAAGALTAPKSLNDQIIIYTTIYQREIFPVFEVGFLPRSSASSGSYPSHSFTWSLTVNEIAVPMGFFTRFSEMPLKRPRKPSTL